MNFSITLFRIIAFLSLAYFFLVFAYSGIQTSFLWFWIFLAILCFGLSYILPRLAAFHQAGTIAAKALLALFWICAVFFIIIETIIITAGRSKPPPDADYVIILGAQVRGTVPSKTLKSRIQCAADYLKENTEAIVICSGGQGRGEDITEAQAIKQGLTANGISPKRILLEEKSTDTVENIAYSKLLIPDASSKKILLITSDFHTFRAKQIGKKQGLSNLFASGTSEFMITTVSYYVREVLAVTKDFIFGNL